MTEAVGIRQGVTNSYHDSTRQFHSSHLPHTPDSGTLSYKRRILNRWTERLTASGLSGNERVTEYLRGKYIKNLSFHTIDHAGGVILSFMRFLNKEGSSICQRPRSRGYGKWRGCTREVHVLIRGDLFDGRP